jgi:hypothetical protein
MSTLYLLRHIRLTISIGIAKHRGKSQSIQIDDHDTYVTEVVLLEDGVQGAGGLVQLVGLSATVGAGGRVCQLSAAGAGAGRARQLRAGVSTVTLRAPPCGSQVPPPRRRRS